MSPMIVKLQDILALPGLNKMKIVAGEKGLDRIVYWPHLIDLPDVIDWVQGGELLFITGIGIKNNLKQLPQIVQECYRKNVAGLAINVGPYIKKTPPKAVALANQLGFPVFEIPWEIKLGEFTRIIYNFITVKQNEENSIQDILENILYGSTDNHDYLLDRAASCNYDLTKVHQIMIVKFENLMTYLKQTNDVTEQQIHLVKLQIQNIIQDVFNRNNKMILIMIRLDTAVIMLPTLRKHEEQQKTRQIAEELLTEFQAKLSGLNLYIGWGKPYNDILEIKKSLSQAEQAMHIAQSLREDHKYKGFDELGFYRVLFNVKDRRELEDFRSEVLDTLLEYDQKHHADLVHTLTVFLEENESFVRVSKLLFIHRNTIKYRLQKVEELTGRSLTNTNDRMLLYFAAIVHKFLSL